MYKLENRSLFKLQRDNLGGLCWMHIAIVPANIETLDDAIIWYYE